MCVTASIDPLLKEESFDFREATVSPRFFLEKKESIYGDAILFTLGRPWKILRLVPGSVKFAEQINLYETDFKGTAYFTQDETSILIFPQLGIKT